MDIAEAFRAHLAQRGIETAPIIPDGRLHRACVVGHRSGSKNLAYVLHADGQAAGWFQEHKSGITGTWKAEASQPFTPADRQRIEAARRERAEQERQRQERAAETARRLWERARPVSGMAHPYLERKHVHAFGLRVLSSWTRRIQDDKGQWQSVHVKNALLVPLRDAEGRLWNVQAIFPERHPLLARDKDFLPGGRLGGLFHAIGPPTPTLIVCEGYATGATLHQETGERVFCAMSAGNLLPVARTVRKLYPGGRIVIAADNDAHTPGNPGLTKAHEAARAVGAAVAVPPIPGDFNDWAAELRTTHGTT